MGEECLGPIVNGRVTSRIGNATRPSDCRFLIMSGQNITSINSDAFTGLTNVFIIDLSSNSFSVLPDNLLNGLTTLRRFYCQRNPKLTYISETMFTGTFLRQMNLWDIGVKILKKSFFLKHFYMLSKLTLGGRHLQSVEPGCFDSLYSLKTFEFGGKKIDEFSFANYPNPFKNTKVESIFFRACRFTKITVGIFNNLPYLIYFRIEYQPLLTSIEQGAFSNLPSLQSFIMRVSKIQYFRNEYLQDSPKLASVYLDFCDLSSLDFYYNKSLHSNLKRI
eukprot:Pgem_evm1s3266